MNLNFNVEPALHFFNLIDQSLIDSLEVTAQILVFLISWYVVDYSIDCNQN